MKIGWCYGPGYTQYEAVDQVMDGAASLAELSNDLRRDFLLCPSIAKGGDSNLA